MSIKDLALVVESRNDLPPHITELVNDVRSRTEKLSATKEALRIAVTDAIKSKTYSDDVNGTFRFLLTCLDRL